MWNSYKKALEDILNKKFSKNFEVGYDPIEVDMFFDKTRNFIGKQFQTLLEHKKIIEQKEEEIKRLQKELDNKNETISILNTEIEDYKTNGYQSQKIIKDISSLSRAVHNLENEKKDNNS